MHCVRAWETRLVVFVGSIGRESFVRDFAFGVWRSGRIEKLMVLYGDGVRKGVVWFGGTLGMI